MKKVGKKPKDVRETKVSLGAINRENLPYPIVYYPNHYGTFFAFSRGENAPVALCSCTRPAILNLVQLKKLHVDGPYTNHLRNTLLDSRFFPDCIAEISIKYENDSLKHINFVDGLCHRCNLINPSLRYCLAMYGTGFVQQYGWFIKQAYLRVGIYPMTFEYLPDVCPSEFQNDITAFIAAHEEYMKEHNKIMEIVNAPDREDIGHNEITYWHNVREEEAQYMIDLRKKRDKSLREFSKKIENMARQEFGFRKVGEGWVSETILYQIVSKIFAGSELIRHYRPEWLGGLELDIFLPSQNVAFEYQGQQHFHSIQAWGGKAALKALQERDTKKAEICSQLGVKLYTIDYTEPLNEEHIRHVLYGQELCSSRIKLPTP